MADEHLIVVLLQIDLLNASILHKNEIVLKQCTYPKKGSMEIVSGKSAISQKKYLVLYRISAILILNAK